MSTYSKKSRTKNAILALVVGAILGLVVTVLVGARADAATANGFVYEVADGKAIIQSCDGACNPTLFIPAQLDGNPVTAIDPAAFQSAGLTQVTFATNSQVAQIGVNAFSGNALGNVVIPASVTKIEPYAFQMAGVTGLIFEQNSQLVTIGDAAFYSNNFQSVTVPSGVTSIGAGAFELSNLSSLSFATGSKVETIGEGAFSGNDLTSLSIPGSVVTIDKEAFVSNKLTSVNFAQSSNLEAIGDAAFAYNDLISLAVPASVANLGDSAFYANELETVQFQPGTQLSKLETSVFQDNKLTSISVPGLVTEISSGAFADNNLGSINFPASNKLATIGTGAFYKNKLTSVVVPAGVTTVGGGAFYDNPNLGDVRFLGNKPAFGTEMEPFRDTGNGPIFYSLARSGWINGEVMSGRTLTGVSQPRITSQPKNVKATVGMTATLSVGVNKAPLGQGDLSYQWFKGSSAIAGATKSTFATKAAGTYKVRVSSWAGSTISSSATVSLVKKTQSAKVKLTSTLKRNKAYRLPLKTNAGMKITWKVKGAGKCKVDKKRGTVKCRVASGKKYTTITGTAKATSTYNSYKVSTKRRIR